MNVSNRSIHTLETQVRIFALKAAVECADQQCPRGGDEGDTCAQHKAMLDTRAAEGKATILVSTIEALTTYRENLQRDLYKPRADWNIEASRGLMCSIAS